MPHVLVKTWSGKTDEQKRELTEKITKAVEETFGAGEYWISVAIEDVDPADWGKVYSEDIEPQGEKLFKKPGYTLDDL